MKGVKGDAEVVAKRAHDVSADQRGHDVVTGDETLTLQLVWSSSSLRLWSGWRESRLQRGRSRCWEILSLPEEWRRAKGRAAMMSFCAQEEVPEVADG
jgi:hypothetical protein